MKGPPLDPGGKDITWPDRVAPRGRKASSTRKIKPQTSNLKIPKQCLVQVCHSTMVCTNLFFTTNVYEVCPGDLCPHN